MRTDETKEESRWQLESRIRSSGRCCDQGKRVHCVCMVSLRCPVHGLICIGTHD
jgi:hypothetical protein